ncbi:hypothetical protein GCM10023149_26880 [Mucilaginibacter gynuensis]|uniref:TonB-like protein n=1 Tax=Mucilaginibacter gynuensis TaxID=1302236 RepID=A0ABP8GIY9_9SPHI
MPLKIFVLILMLLVAGFGLKAQIPKASELPEDVGDIVFDPKTDKADFFFCHKDYIIQYYNYGTKYKGGGKAIRDFINSKFQYKPAYAPATGFITVRFVINCKGETDRFRVLQLNKDYQKTLFDTGLTNQMLKLCKALNQWLPGKDDKGNFYDSYYYLNFKLVNGRIKAITP